MFIQVIQGKVADAEGLRAAMDRWGRDLQPGATGWLGTTGGITDDGTFVATVRFDSEDAARRNSERPEQGAWWAATERCFDGPVTFFDCPQVDVWMNGGSDDAGFVQVIQGRLDDPARFREFMSQPMDMLQEARPEIIGGTIAIDADGWFTETMAFRSEAEARKGEQVEMPEEMSERFTREMEQVKDMRYLDLHHPWFASAGADAM